PIKCSLRSQLSSGRFASPLFVLKDRLLRPWLDTVNLLIIVVDPREICTDSDALPVFNSHAIESQLHHIPGLSERYVYLNDDIFFLRPTDPSLFFTGNGHSKFFPSKAPLDIDPPSVRDLPVLSAAK